VKKRGLEEDESREGGDLGQEAIFKKINIDEGGRRAERASLFTKRGKKRMIEREIPTLKDKEGLDEVRRWWRKRAFFNRERREFR